MVVKVCGLIQPENIADLLAIEPKIDYFGSISYADSPRHCDDALLEKLSFGADASQKVLVVVDMSIEDILTHCEKYGYTIVQLHSSNYTKQQAIQLIDAGLEVWKVFSIKYDLPREIEKWHGYADLFLFDTKTPKHGGSGEQFDWSVLSAYKGPTAFILSGGVGIQDATRVRKYKHEFCIGVDINSRFETEPGIKDVGLVSEFLNKVK